MRYFKSLATGIIFILLCTATSAQRVYTYYLDEYLNIVPQDNKECIYKGKGSKEGELFKVDCFAKETNILIITAHFSDSLLSTLDGELTSFYPNGYIESRRFFSDGERDGIWERWDNQQRKLDSTVYKKGQVLANASYQYFIEGSNKNPAEYHFTDSLNHIYRNIQFSADGKPQIESGINKEGKYFSTIYGDSTADETVYTKVDEEASFPGGNMSWSRYLQKALNGYNPADYGAKPGKYQVIVRFVVSEDGSISKVKAETNFGHKMEEVSVNAIVKGPRWIPAKKDGEVVKAYRRQPITYIVEIQ